ncbi:hypothetical protein B0H10DRAFT_2213698 [Mycena sp. CBHHK59/15]|nr:hypothetical protein B0H10DRAFT_2213698 [Mycena sp. CBHHK59/15]
MCLQKPQIKFFASPDLVLLMFQSCTLNDLAQFAHCSRVQRNQVRRYLVSQMCIALSRFFDRQQQDALFAMLDQSDAGIFGSVTAHITRPDVVLSTADAPRDVNITIAGGTGPAWHAFMMELGATACSSVPVRVPLMESLLRVTKYAVRSPKGARQYIYVSESRTASILVPLLSSEWTHQMTAVLGTKIVVVYPQLHAAGRTMPGFDVPTRGNWTRWGLRSALSIYLAEVA